MIKKIFALLTLVLLTSSCSIYHITSTSSSDDYYPSNTTSGVVYLDEIDDSYEIIGTVLVNSERRQRYSDVIRRMQREAAILGGEAITDLRTDATGTWKRLPAQQRIGNGYVRANFTASVVVSK